MVNLLKTFGKGILYIIGFPFFIVALLIFGVIGIFLFIFHLFKSIIYFFTGQKFFPELPEDKELRLRQEAAYAAANPQPIIDQEPIAQESSDNVPPPMIEEVVFNEETSFNEASAEETIENVKEESTEETYSEQDEQDTDVLSELARNEPEQSIDTSSNEEEIEDEPLEEYVPRGSAYIGDIEEDDTNTGGVDIDYDVR